jgi:hypothetical protein
MKDSLKVSLSAANKLMWASLTIAITLILFEPSAEKATILGVSIDRSRLLVLGPAALLAVLLAR